MKSTLSRPNVHISYEQVLRPYHRKVAELVTKYARDGASVLDIGCGVGYTLRYIHDLNPSFTLNAADIDPVCVERTAECVPLSGRIVLDRTEELFDAGARYDVIVMSHVLEHTTRPVDVVQGIVSILNPGGIAVLAVPNPVRLKVIVSSLRRRHYVNRGHAYAWDRSHWMNFLENIAGVDVIHYDHDAFPVHPRLQRLETFLGNCFPWLTFSNIAVIRAPSAPSSDESRLAAPALR